MKILKMFAAFAALGLMVAGAGGQTASAARQTAAEPQLVFLDTDIGDDIDDAFALALVLQSPELKLVGITTAYGDTDLRAKLVQRYLGSLCRFDANVIPGVPTPHENVFTQAAYAHGFANPVCGKSWIYTSSKADEARLKKQRKQEAAKRKAAEDKSMAGLVHLLQQRTAHDAAGFLFDQIREHPGEITLIAIGPLTNVQAAIERDPDTFRKLKRVVIMGGSVYRGYDDWKTGTRQPPSSEWNVRCDPAGLRALLSVGVPVFMMPLDSTQIRLETKEREAIFSHGSPLTDQLTLLYHQWLGGNPDHALAPTLFDPVAVTYAIRPDLCPVTPMRIEVDDKGFTRPVDGAPNAQVCLKSDEKGFLELLVERIVGATPAFTLSVSAPKTTLVSGEPIRLDVTIENHTDRLIMLPDYRSSAGITVWDSGGNILSRAEAAQFHHGSIFASMVESGKTITESLNVGRFFDLTKPGEYSIEIEGRDQDSKSVSKSNTVTVTVTP
jgi:purine nucleosidase